MSVETRTAARVESVPAAWPRAALRRVAIARVDVLLALLLFTMAIIPRAAWVAYNDRAPQGLNDPTIYNILADIMADGGGYTRPTGEPFAYYPVGFPATMAGLKKASDLVGAERSIFQLKMMNGMFGALTVVLVYALASRIFDRRVGFASGALLSIFPSQVFYTGTLLSEPLFTLLFIAALSILFWSPWKREGMPNAQLRAAGLVLSAATMTRGITLLLPLVFFGIWFFYLHSRKRALMQTLILFAGIAVLIVPWSIRNSVQFGTLVGPSTNVGDDLCIGNFEGSTGAFTLIGKCFEGYEGMGPDEVEIERNRDGLRIAVEDTLANPIRPRLFLDKAWWLMYKDDDGLWAAESYGHDYFIDSPRREILSFAANGIYYATFFVVLVGGLAFVLSRDLRRLGLVLVMLYVLAIPLAFFGDPRFHFPAIPIATVIAGATIVSLWSMRKPSTVFADPYADAPPMPPARMDYVDWRMRGIATLRQRCRRFDVADARPIIDSAIADLRAEGAAGSIELAKLMLVLVQCRNPYLDDVIAVAAEVQPVEELVAALKVVRAAEDTAPAPPASQAGFPSEIVDGGRVGWTPETGARIRDAADALLRRLGR